MSKASRCAALLIFAVQALAPLAAHAEPAAPLTDEQRRQIVQRLQELKDEKQTMQRAMQSFDARIDELEAAMRGAPLPPKRAAAKPRTASPARGAPPSRTSTTITTERTAASPPIVLTDASPPPQAQSSEAPPAKAPPTERSWTPRYERGSGFVAVRGDDGEVSIALITYFRYLNQLRLDPTYTDSFGRTFKLDLRQDFRSTRSI